jgi:hypothetical protein
MSYGLSFIVPELQLISSGLANKGGQMKNIPRRIIILLVAGISVALWHIFIGFSSPNIVSLILGIICFILMLSLLLFQNWSRVLILIFAGLSIAIYVLLLIATAKKAFQGFAGIALLFYSPLFILGLLIIDTLNKKEIKNLYIK